MYPSCPPIPSLSSHGEPPPPHTHTRLLVESTVMRVMSLFALTRHRGHEAYACLNPIYGSHVVHISRVQHSLSSAFRTFCPTYSRPPEMPLIFSWQPCLFVFIMMQS